MVKVCLGGVFTQADIIWTQWEESWRLVTLTHGEACYCLQFMQEMHVHFKSIRGQMKDWGWPRIGQRLRVQRS